MLDLKLHRGNWSVPYDVPTYIHYSGISQAMFKDIDMMVELEEKLSRKERIALDDEEKMRMFRAVRCATNIYFISAPSQGLIKIGKANNVHNRLITLRSGSPAELNLLASVRFFPVMEKFLHKQLAAHKSHGEWFKATDEVLNVVEAALDHGSRGIMEALNIDIASLPEE